MAGSGKFAGWINPLRFFPIDEPSPTDPPSPSPEAFLDFLCPPGISCDPASLAMRYREIAQEEDRLFVVPAEPRILQKLIWPLRDAKAAYVIGNYLATIALGGMVAEMVATLLFDTAEASVNNRKMTASDQRAIFGREFEKLDQFRRIEVLYTYGIIDDTTKSAFDRIRTIRKKYLHLWSQDHADMPTDAVTVYHSALTIVVQAIGPDLREGGIVLKPGLVRYLEKAGVYKSAEPKQSPGESDAD
jgi:hypothetical protein